MSCNGYKKTEDFHAFHTFPLIFQVENSIIAKSITKINNSHMEAI